MDKLKTVDDFLSSLDEGKKQQVLKIRECIMEAAPKLEEHIKWNAPSYVQDGEDRITFNLFNKEGLVKLIFHMGASRKENRKVDPTLKDAPLVEWTSDIRGYATFTGMNQIEDNKSAIKDTVSRWLAIKW